MLTVVILTQNEAVNLPRCLAAIPARYPIVILDSGSSDDTLSIAKNRACRIYSNPWPGFAEQRNFALGQCDIDTPWLLFVDADEIYPAAFYDKFDAGQLAIDEIDVLMVPSILYLRDKRLNHAPGYPIYHPRLVRRETTRFVRNHTGHGEAVIDSCRVAYSDIAYEHYFYHGEIIEWMHKHVDHANREIRINKEGIILNRRKWLSLKLGNSILRAPLRFIYHYVICRGFLDGRAGLEYSFMFAWYEATKYLLARFGEKTP